MHGDLPVLSLNTFLAGYLVLDNFKFFAQTVQQYIY